MYGLAAVSKEPSPFPMIKMAAQNPPKDRARMQGQATNAPIPDFKFVNTKSPGSCRTFHVPYKHKPQIKVARYPKCRKIQLACPRDARG